MSDEGQVRSRQNTGSTPVSVPVDILLCWCLLAAAVIVAMIQPGTALRAAVAAPVLFFLPGYVTVAAAFPHRETVPNPHLASDITVGERLALGFGLSVALLPLLGLVVAVLPGGLATANVAGVLGAYVVIVGALAGLQRLRVAPADRFRLPIGRWANDLGTALERGSPIERAMTVALVLSVVLAVGAGGYALAAPNEGETYTDFHLVTEDGDGYVAADYPTDLTRGEPAQYTVGIENHEGQAMEYDVVVTIDRVVEEGGDQRVAESVEVDRMDASVEPGEEWLKTHTVTPELAGEDLRLTYHLYRGEAPDSVDRDSADRYLHLWVDVDD